MSNLVLMITIMERKLLPEFISLYRSVDLSLQIITLGHGTASGTVRSRLGLDSSERAVMFSFTNDCSWKRIKKLLEYRIQIDIPGKGIAFTIPMSSIMGKRSLDFLYDGIPYDKEESELKGTEKELLVAICDQGYNEMVMDAARTAGASGGTYIHAKGTGMEKAEQFLGVTLAKEKDILFLVAKTEKKNEIMKAVNDKAGPATKAKTIIFSVPVTDTAGMRLLESESADFSDESQK